MLSPATPGVSMGIRGSFVGMSSNLQSDDLSQAYDLVTALGRDIEVDSPQFEAVKRIIKRAELNGSIRVLKQIQPMLYDQAGRAVAGLADKLSDELKRT